MIEVTIVLVNDGYASTAIAPLEIFSSAGVLQNAFDGRAPTPHFHVSVASVDGKPVRSAHRMAVEAQVAIDDVDRSDVVFVSAIGLDIDGALKRHRRLPEWLRDRHRQGALVAGGCAGVAFLAESGLLDGRRATTHWALADDFAARYPDVHWHPEAFVTDDGGILCGGGVYGVIDLSLHVVEKLCGHEVAVECAKSMLMEMPRVNQFGFAEPPLGNDHGDTGIRRAEQWLQRHFADEVSVEALAGRLNMSQRNFERRFKTATGRRPLSYLQSLRVWRAKRLLESGARSIEQVAHNVGYRDVAYFRMLFRRHTGMAPAAYRQRFGPRLYNN